MAQFCESYESRRAHLATSFLRCINGVVKCFLVLDRALIHVQLMYVSNVVLARNRVALCFHIY